MGRLKGILMGMRDLGWVGGTLVWLDVGLVGRMLGGLRDVWCVGGMLGGMKECWLGWGDIG